MLLGQIQVSLLVFYAPSILVGVVSVTHQAPSGALKLYQSE